MSPPSRESLFLAEVARQLIAASQAGTQGGGRQTAEGLRKLASGCRALRYKRLYWILEALASRLSKPRSEMEPDQLEEFGRLLADARYTCKALKSMLQGSLTDLRVQEDLVGSAARPTAPEEIQNRSLIRVGEAQNQEGEIRYRTTFLLDLTDEQLYSTRSHRPVKDGSLASPFPDLGPSPLVRLGRALPSFSPQRIQIELHEPGSVHEGRLREFLEYSVPDSLGGLLERFRSVREEYLSPRTLPVFFRPAAFDPSLPGCLWDRHGNQLPLLREASHFGLCEHLAYLLRTPPESTWAVFGKLVFVHETFFLQPWSLLCPETDPPVTLLRQGPPA